MFDAAPSEAPLPLTQSAEFARAMGVMGSQVETVLFERQGFGLMQSRQLPVLGRIGLISRGPVWIGVGDAGLLRERLSGLGHPVIINAEAGQDELLRASGLLPVMTPATIAELDLSCDGTAFRNGMHQKWRNRLRRAEERDLQVLSRSLPDVPDHWLLKAESRQRLVRRYRGLPPEFALAYTRANPHMARLLEARLNGQCVAAMLFLLHGEVATYFMGHTTAAGRVCHAHNLLLAQGAAWLSRRGVTRLDLGTLDTENSPGLARFKLGCGATAKRLGGSWLFSRALSKVLGPGRRAPRARPLR